MTFRIALVGKPNSGKSVLFNLLTGARQKVANYPGVTVDVHEGPCRLAGGLVCTLVDLPGCYSLGQGSPEEWVSALVLSGEKGPPPDAVVCVIEATRLQVGLSLLRSIRPLGLPTVVLLNKMDQARRRGIYLDIPALERVLCLPVLAVTATQKASRAPIVRALSHLPSPADVPLPPISEILAQAILNPGRRDRLTHGLDQVLLHPVAGLLCFFVLVFLLFQAVFSWASIPTDMLDSFFTSLIASTRAVLPASSFTDLLCDGVLAGVGGVLVFLPQLLILFAGIVLMEDSGYMARAAVLLDGLMRRMGLNGKAFIPLLASYACAIPAITATRIIDQPKDRLLTVLLIPLTTCSARLPVYALLIAAFVPSQTVLGWFNLQGVVMFALYLLGAVSVLVVGKVLHLTLLRGGSSPLLLELPDYCLPHVRTLLATLTERCAMFIRRAGVVIVPATIVIWALSNYPSPPTGASEPAIYYSFVSRIGRLLQPLFAPLGFNWQMVAALIPGMAAREVAIGVLATVYSVGENGGDSLRMVLQQQWSLAAALAFLTWYVYAPQCIATLVVIRRETRSLAWTYFATGYLFLLAYLVAALVHLSVRVLS